MRWISRGSVLVSVLLTAAVAAPALAQMALTTVADTVYNADGTPAQGSVLVSWSAFTTANGAAIAAGSTSATLSTTGGLSLSLTPNAGATPTGTYYTAVFHLSDGTTSRQYWVVPVQSTPVKLSALQNQVLPTAVAMQTVSKAYVDHAIAAAVVGGAPAATGATPAYVQRTGDSMSGPLVLPGDPVSALQAADKHYVDASVAALGGGAAQKVSTLPSATQTVVQPAGTQLEVTVLNGALDATGYLTGNGSNGIGNALASGNCGSGCELQVSASYPGNDQIPFGGTAAGTRVVDRRGGARVEVAQDPLPPVGGNFVANEITQVTTRTAQQAYSVRPSTGANFQMLALTHNAETGGTNQFPADIEQVPYNKANYGITQFTGNYSTQGQHVQNTNSVNCFSVGDCLAGGQFILSAGGYRDQADEGTHPFDLQVGEDTRVFRGNCGTGCTTGATSVHVNATQNGGTQGDGRYLMDTNPSKVLTSGRIVGASGDYLPIVNFSGTNFPVSVQMLTAAPALSQARDLTPGTVTLPMQTSGLVAGYVGNTAALPAASGVACVTDQGVFPNFETASYAAVDGSHLQLTLKKVHKSGAVVSVGGLCGYGLEEVVDTQNGIRQVFPVAGSPSATQVYYASAQTYIVGVNTPVSTSGFQSATAPVANAARSGNTVTLNLAQALPYDMNGLAMVVSGMADPTYNGTFTVTTTGPTSVSYTANGPDGSSSGGTVSYNNGSFALYPMAEVLSVYNPAAGGVDGQFTLAANTVPWAAGDPVEEPHYYQQLVYADTEWVTQYVPRPAQYSAAGKIYFGQMGPGARGWEVLNSVPNSNYLGAGGTHQVPDAALLTGGAWKNALEMDAGTEAAVRVHCNLHGCGRWDSGYALVSMDSSRGQDFLLYYPQANTASWLLGGTTFNFAPSGFSAPAVTTNTVNMSGVTLTSGGGQATLTSSVGPVGATLTTTNNNNGTAIPLAAYCPNATAGNPCLFPIGTSFAANSVGLLAWQPAGFFQMQTYNNGSPIQIGGSAINTTASLMVNNGAGVNQLGATCPAGISLCVNPQASMTVDANGKVTAQAFHAALRTPGSSSESCSPGDFADDANFHYVCVANNTWKRAALSSF